MNLWECEPWGPRAVSRPTSPTMLLSPVVAPGTNQTLPDIWHHLDFSTYHHDQTLKWIKVGFLSWTLSWVDQTPRKNILCCYLFTSWIWEAFLLEISAQTILPTRHTWAMYQLILLALSWTLLVGNLCWLEKMQYFLFSKKHFGFLFIIIRRQCFYQRGGY